MHLHGEEYPATNDKGSNSNSYNKMANCGVDVRLRRQTPVSIKPPRLRLSATASNGNNKVSTSRLSANAQQHQHGKQQSSNSSTSNNNTNNNTLDVTSSKSQSGTNRITSRSSRSSSVSKISGSSSCGRRIRGRSRAGLTSSTFKPSASLDEPESNLGTSGSEPLSKVTTSRLSRSCENVGTAVFSAAVTDNSSNSGRPLIHHQRHNLKNRFQLLKTLGEGTYGKVKLAADKTSGEQVAIKYIKKTKIVDDADLARIRREIQILSSVRHTHVVNIREVFEKKDKIVLVMDYAQGGELYDYLNKMGRLSEWEARRIFRQIVSAIHCCHQNGIVHRDLKLENIILDDEGNVKIADFGLANYYSHSNMLSTFCGSPLYASPEIVNGRSYYGPEVDVWSLGVILYTLVYGSMPFESNSLVSLKQQISDGDYRQPSRPSDAAGLIRHMLTVTPARRATMDDALRHWWINFGHAQMPNGQPYNPCDEDEKGPSSTISTVPHEREPISSVPPLDLIETPTPAGKASISSGVSERRDPVTSSQSLGDPQFQRRRRHSLDGPCPFPLTDPGIVPGPPPAIIHQRKQSSLSSDSDAELEFFRSPRWEQSQTQPDPQEKKSVCESQIHHQQQQQQQQQRRRGWRFGLQKIASGPLDSTGNSVSSSGSASPAPHTEDQSSALDLGHSQELCGEESLDTNVSSSQHSGQDESHLSSNMLKLPPALLDILGGCSEKSLAALLSPDPDTNIVSFNPFGLLGDFNNTDRTINGSSHNAIHLTNPAINSSNNTATPISLNLGSVPNANDITNNNIHNVSNAPNLNTSHTPVTVPTSDVLTSTSSTTDTFVFDSERKPKRSILKRRGKFSGDSPEKPGDDQKDNEDDGHIPKSGGGHLPRRLPSFRDEAHGIFASRHRASQLLEQADRALALVSCSSALLHSHHTPWGSRNAASLNNTSEPYSGQTEPTPLFSVDCSSSSISCQRNNIHDSMLPSQAMASSDKISFPLKAVNVTDTLLEISLTSQQDKRQRPTAAAVESKLFQPENGVKNSHLTMSACRGSLHDSNGIDADAANGNFPSTAINGKLPGAIQTKTLPSDVKGSTIVMPAVINGEVHKDIDDILANASPSDLSSNCARNSAVASDPTPAKSYTESASSSNNNNDPAVMLHGESSANSSPTRFSKPQSANLSHRSSASNSSGDSAYDSSSLSSYPSPPSSAPLSSTASSMTSSSSKVVRRSSAMMKASQLEQARNRLSISSIGSNSSADILDLSYDSGDSDHFVNLDTQSAERTSSPESCKASDVAVSVLRAMSESDTSTRPTGTQSLTAKLHDGLGNYGQELQSAQRTVCDDVSLLDMECPSLSGLPANVCHKQPTSLPTDMDLMVFPDDEEDRQVHETALSAKNAGQTANTVAIKDNSSRSDQPAFKSLSEDLETLNLNGVYSEEHVMPEESAKLHSLAFPNDEHGLETSMAAPGVGQSRPQVPVPSVDPQSSQQVLNITEAGSPLLYRLTREAQTWL